MSNSHLRNKQVTLKSISVNGEADSGSNAEVYIYYGSTSNYTRYPSSSYVELTEYSTTTVNGPTIEIDPSSQFYVHINELDDWDYDEYVSGYFSNWYVSACGTYQLQISLTLEGSIYDSDSNPCFIFDDDLKQSLTLISEFWNTKIDYHQECSSFYTYTLLFDIEETKVYSPPTIEETRVAIDRTQETTAKFNAIDSNGLELMYYGFDNNGHNWIYGFQYNGEIRIMPTDDINPGEYTVQASVVNTCGYTATGNLAIVVGEKARDGKMCFKMHSLELSKVGDIDAKSEELDIQMRSPNTYHKEDLYSCGTYIFDFASNDSNVDTYKDLGLTIPCIEGENIRLTFIERDICNDDIETIAIPCEEQGRKIQEVVITPDDSTVSYSVCKSRADEVGGSICGSGGVAAGGEATVEKCVGYTHGWGEEECGSAELKEKESEYLLEYSITLEECDWPIDRPECSTDQITAGNSCNFTDSIGDDIDINEDSSDSPLMSGGFFGVCLII